MDTLLVVGIALLVSWLGVEISSRMLKYFEDVTVAVGSLAVSAAVIYALFTLGIL